MAKKILEVEVLHRYTLEIDTQNGIVKEYESENDLILDCASYRFLDILPVLQSDGGVRVQDVELLSID